MPHCFSLTKKGETRPSKLHKIDSDMRDHFNAEPDEKNWFRGWYSWLGLGLAVGRSFQDMKQDGNSRKHLEVIEWVEANYTSDAWRER